MLISSTMLTLSLAGAVLVLLAIAVAYVLGWANRAFHVEVDPRVEAVCEALPGANCGACGYVGCAEYAEALARGEAPPSLCAPGGSSCALKIAAILGVQVGESLPYRPVVHCAATRENRLLLGDYHGEPSCTAANLVAGVQGCAYGCLGMGDCQRACQYDAIHVVNGLSVVDYEKCIGCGACARICPRNIITMVPFKSDRMFVIACSNQDTGPDVKKVCKVGCIGCAGCTRRSDQIAMNGGLPAINYAGYDQARFNFEELQQKCPMGIMLFVGKPSADEIAQVADEELPAAIQADFKTTVDDTEWRG